VVNGRRPNDRLEIEQAAKAPPRAGRMFKEGFTMKSLTENSNQVYISKPQFVHRNGPEAGQSEASFFQLKTRIKSTFRNLNLFTVMGRKPANPKLHFFNIPSETPFARRNRRSSKIATRGGVAPGKQHGPSFVGELCSNAPRRQPK
jgi:hypothetical protein